MIKICKRKWKFYEGLFEEKKEVMREITLS